MSIQNRRLPFLGYMSIILLLFTACKSARNLSAPVKTKSVNLSPIDSLVLTIEAIDLSEDVSTLSTKNDEVLLFIYEIKDSSKLGKSLFRKQLILDRTSRLKSIDFSFSKRLMNAELLFFLIEQDSEIPIEKIDRRVSNYYREIIAAFKAKKDLEIEKYLGDDDVLGVKTITELKEGQTLQFSFKGMHRLDRYNYQITIGE